MSFMGKPYVDYMMNFAIGAMSAVLYDSVLQHVWSSPDNNMWERNMRKYRENYAKKVEELRKKQEAKNN